MTIIKEVLDAIAAVSEGIDHIQTISEAIKEGTDYLKSTHPNVAGDVAAMCEEMRKSSQAIASASSIVTHFRFVIGDVNAAEASRFNEHLVNHKAQAESVQQQLQSMRGHCSVIKEHAEAIRENARPTVLKSIAEAFGLRSATREQQLAKALQSIYDEEMEYHLGVYQMANAVQKTLKAVQDELGPPGIIAPENVPKAANLLGEYAVAFSDLESRCNHNALTLQASVDALRQNV